MESELTRVESFFNEYVFGFIHNDLQAAITGKANFLGALGLFSYTEAIGAFLPPLDKESGSYRERRFYRCLFRLPNAEEWKNVDKHIRENTRPDRGIYKHLRHSMAHIYFPLIKKNSHEKLFIPVVIAMDSKGGLPIGIKSDGLVAIVVNNWRNDFMEGCKIFIDEMKKDEKWLNAAITHLNKEY